MSDICCLDGDDCLKLDSICRAFHCGIKEEHSWALIYQALNALKEYIDGDNGKPKLIEPNTLFIRSNGTVHQKSWQCSDDMPTNVSVSQVVSFIAKDVYKALDYGTADDEEMIVPQLLEEVFIDMTQSSSVDEGIEEMDDIGFHSVLNTVLDKCESRVIDEKIGEHYRNVCRALVAEAIEVSTFLNQISKGTKVLKKIKNIDNEEVDDIHVEVWAHLWMKVMRQLRIGVSLKTIDRKELINRQQKEYELTPFEMLLDDINSKRYSLKKVSIPKRVEKDARNMILDFIRSRPPLKPAAQRQLSPAPKVEPCLHDKLMEGIKQTPKLRPTPKIPEQPFVRKFNSYHMPRGKRFSIFSKNVAIDYPDSPTTVSTDNVFERFSLRNLSLRSTIIKQNITAKNVGQIESSSVSNQPTNRVSFWRKLLNVL